MAQQPSENIAVFLEKVSEKFFFFDGNPKPFIEAQHFLKKGTKPNQKNNFKTSNKKYIFLCQTKALAERVAFTSVSFHLS